MFYLWDMPKIWFCCHPKDEYGYYLGHFSTEFYVQWLDRSALSFWEVSKKDRVNALPGFWDMPKIQIYSHPKDEYGYYLGHFFTDFCVQWLYICALLFREGSKKDWVNALPCFWDMPKIRIYSHPKDEYGYYLGHFSTKFYVQ